MLTTDSSIIYCTFEQAEFVAECAGLRYLQGDNTKFNELEREWLRKNWWELSEKDKNQRDFPEHNLELYRKELKKTMRVAVNHEINFSEWEDRATGGGGARICWCSGVAWITRHSGYPQANITQEVAELFAEIGCKPVPDFYEYNRLNPIVYGFREWKIKPQGNRLGIPK